MPVLAGNASGVLLVVSTTEETAKRIESYLRNAGHPLRCNWTNSVAEMEQLLQGTPPDVLLCDDAHPVLAAEPLIRRVAELNPDLPVLLVGDSMSADDGIRALAIGAKNWGSYAKPEHLRHLELVIVREFMAHFHLRTLRLVRGRLNDFEQRHSRLLESTTDAVARVHEGIFFDVNPAFVRMLGRNEASDLVGLPLIDFVTDDQRTKVKERLRNLAKGKQNGDLLEFSFNTGTTAMMPVQMNLGLEGGEKLIEMLVRATAPVEVEAPQAAVVDLSATRRVQATGRLGFQQAIAARQTNTMTVRGAIMVLADHFPALEERIGFIGAEEILSQLGFRLQEKLDGSPVFRFSDNALCAVVSCADVGDFEALGQQLVTELGSLIYSSMENEAHLTLSVILYPLAGSEKPLAVVTEVAREARRLSEKGGNQAAVIGTTAQSNQSEREAARKGAQLKKAIDSNQLKLVYQTIASLEGDSRQYFEVSIRMLDENGKEIAAAEFLPIAEQFGLMKSIDRWVLARSLVGMAKLGSDKEVPSLFVKISEDSMKDAASYALWVSERLKAQPLKNAEFVFAIQEMVLQNHIRKAKILIETLSELNAGISIDHFGVSANSLQLIEHLPKISFVKFHPSFTQKFNDKETQRRMMQLLEVAKQKKIKTIVSHVEDANVMARLWQMGVNYIQGYHLQDPDALMVTSQFITKVGSIHAPR